MDDSIIQWQEPWTCSQKIKFLSLTRHAGLDQSLYLLDQGKERGLKVYAISDQ